MSQILKAQSSESDTDFIQNISINSCICSENETLAKAKRGLNKIYTKHKEYDIYKEELEDIKIADCGFGVVYRRPANDKHEYVYVIYPNRSR
jgi:hypothetical protein